MTNAQLTRAIGLKIKEARLNKGIGVGALAKLTGVQKCSLYRIEAGTSVPRALNLYMISCALGISPNKLFPKIKKIKRA